MKRRDFLKRTVVAGTAGTLLDACAPGVEQLIPALVPEDEFIPGAEEFLAATCFECDAGCGLLARKIDGRIVKVEGNPAHPVSQGGSCVRAQALPQSLYHPDRVRAPLVRDGERGAGVWHEVSWEEALDRLASELSSLQGQGRADALAVVSGPLRGHQRDIVHRFLAGFGSPRHFVHDPFGDVALRRGHALTTGVAAPFAYDFERARYVVAFGATQAESGQSPVRFARGLAHMRRGRPGIRGKFVAVHPRLSMTAANADEWLPVRPGLEAAVALALANVLVRDGLHDAAGVEAAEGFAAFRDEVLPAFRPEAVAEAAGVEAAALERIAHEMAEHRPGFVLVGDTVASSRHGAAVAVAVSHLNALLGSFGAEGGVFFGQPPPFTPWPALAETATMVEERPLLAGLTETLDVQAAVVLGGNPLYSTPAGAGVAGFLARVPFVAAMGTVIDETMAVADLILPESTSFERHDDDVPDGVIVPTATLSGPVFSRPLFDTRSMPDVLLAVASRLGGAVAGALPWETYEAALESAWIGLRESGRGSVSSPLASQYFARAVAAGGWWDAEAAPAAVFATESGAYRFETAALAGVPREAPPPSDERTLTLHVYPSPAFGDGRSARLPFLQEVRDPMTGVRWGSVVEINPDTASAAGIADGDRVEVTADGGALTATAHLRPGVRPDVVAMAAGQGHTVFGRYASGVGSNASSLLSVSIDVESRDAALIGGPVAIRRV